VRKGRRFTESRREAARSWNAVHIVADGESAPMGPSSAGQLFYSWSRSRSPPARRISGPSSWPLCVQVLTSVPPTSTVLSCAASGCHNSASMTATRFRLLHQRRRRLYQRRLRVLGEHQSRPTLAAASAPAPPKISNRRRVALRANADRPACPRRSFHRRL
jgi:hypothetical protein